MFPKNSDYHGYNTRNKNELIVEKHRMALFERGPRGAGVNLYNKLPSCLTIQSREPYRAALKRGLMEGAFYSIDEFKEALSDGSFKF
jgi:hypothetical protein